MALQNILDAIVADAARETAAIEQAGEAAYQERMQEAVGEAEALRASIMAEARRAAEHEQARRLHRVRLEALRERVQVQEAAFQEAVRRSRETLAQARHQDGYHNALTQLLAEALAEYEVQDPVRPGDAEAVVVAHPDDVQVIRRILSAQERHLQRIEIQADLAPGVIVRSPDGRIESDNTLPSRLQRALPDLHSLLSDLLRAEELQ